MSSRELKLSGWWTFAAILLAISGTLNVIWGMGSDGKSRAWALGHYRAADHHLHAFVLRWNGSSWDQIPVDGASKWSPTVAAGTSSS